MGFFRLLLRPRWRLFFFGLVALGLQIALLLISPAQVPVVLYKLALVMLADFAIAKGYLWPFVMACLRRAAVVAAFVVAVSVGL